MGVRLAHRGAPGRGDLRDVQPRSVQYAFSRGSTFGPGPLLALAPAIRGVSGGSHFFFWPLSNTGTSRDEIVPRGTPRDVPMSPRCQRRGHVPQLVLRDTSVL